MKHPWAALSALYVGLFMTILDGTIVNVALPSMISALSTGLDEAVWINSAYLLAFAVPLLVAGRLGDRFGPRRLFVAGLTIFTAASASCGLAWSPTALVVSRAIQGLGAAAMAPQPMAFVTRLFPPARRGAPMGMSGTIVGIASIAGPLFGGFLVETMGWRWVFFVNVPIGIAAIILTFMMVPDWRPQRSHRFDPIGIALSGIGLFAVVFGIQEGQRYDWAGVYGAVTIPEIVGTGVVALVIFGIWQVRNRQEPLLQLRIFRYRNFSLANLASLTVGFATGGMFLPLIIYIQTVLGYSAVKSGLITAPMALISGIVAPFAGRMSDRIGGRWIAAGGFATFALGIALLVVNATTEAGGWSMVVPFLVCGIGVACIFSPIANLAIYDLEPRLIGMASGIFATTRQVGGVIGNAAIGVLLQARLAAELTAHVRTAAKDLPFAYRAEFINKLSTGGSAPGAGPQLRLPAETPSGVARQIHESSTHLFDAAFVNAMQSALLLPIIVLVIGLVGCLAMRPPA